MKKLLNFAIAAAFLLSACERETVNDEFASCIKESGAVFYGAFWCPHCQDQKSMFGDSVELLPYVECDAGGKNGNPELCAEKSVTQYPTWIYPDGAKVTGVQSFEELSQKTSCALPGNESVMVK